MFFFLLLRVCVSQSVCLSVDSAPSLGVYYFYVAAKATYIRLLHGKIGFFRP